ncbi:uncharacterized protein LOC143280216 [Babylonia areolata]|uniref:uncharacterized protein LOC143280216 n=1 Tax=Babylonia areolata TaxID=304850 RepID=UPI003FD09A7F
MNSWTLFPDLTTTPPPPPESSSLPSSPQHNASQVPPDIPLFTLTTTNLSTYRLGSGGGGSIPADVLFKQHVQRYAYGYLMLGVCLAGLVGNVLTFAVLSRKTMRCSSTATYLRSLALVDTCVLVLAVFRYRSYYVFMSEREVIRVIINFDRYVQVYVVPFFWISLGMSSYIILSLSLERYLVIRWPFTLLKTARVRWVTVVRCGTGAAVMLVWLLTLPLLLCYRVVRTSFRHLPVAAVLVTDRYLPNPRAYLHTYNHYLLPLAWYTGPWGLVAVVNALLFWQVRKSSRIRVGVPNSLNPNRNLSLLIILIVGVYMVCHLPRCALALYCLADRCSTNNDGEDVDTRCFLLLKVTADLLNVLNSCLNTLVYCFSGAKFRREVKGLLLCRWWCHHNAVSPPTPHSVHVSLHEVPATPPDTPGKSRNLSFQELRLPSGVQRNPFPEAVSERAAPAVFRTAASLNHALVRDA